MELELETRWSRRYYEAGGVFKEEAYDDFIQEAMQYRSQLAYNRNKFLLVLGYLWNPYLRWYSSDNETDKC